MKNYEKSIGKPNTRYLAYEPTPANNSLETKRQRYQSIGGCKVTFKILNVICSGGTGGHWDEPLRPSSWLLLSCHRECCASEFRKQRGQPAKDANHWRRYLPFSPPWGLNRQKSIYTHTTKNRKRKFFWNLKCWVWANSLAGMVTFPQTAWTQLRSVLRQVTGYRPAVFLIWCLLNIFAL